MKKGVGNFCKKTDEEKLKLLQSYIEEIEIILENNDIEIYETGNRENIDFDAKRQKIIKKSKLQMKSCMGKFIIFQAVDICTKEG